MWRKWRRPGGWIMCAGSSPCKRASTQTNLLLSSTTEPSTSSSALWLTKSARWTKLSGYLWACILTQLRSTSESMIPTLSPDKVVQSSKNTRGRRSSRSCNNLLNASTLIHFIKHRTSKETSKVLATSKKWKICDWLTHKSMIQNTGTALQSNLVSTLKDVSTTWSVITSIKLTRSTHIWSWGLTVDRSMTWSLSELETIEKSTGLSQLATTDTCVSLRSSTSSYTKL